MTPLRPHPRTLPLGIDIGSERIRASLVHRNRDGSTELIAVATREHDNDPATALTAAVTELRTRERRCVFSLGEPRAILRALRFPPMRRLEHERAARYEATQFIDYPIAEAAVRVVSPTHHGDTVIGVVRKDVIASLVALAHAAKLRVTAIDNDAFALRRALPNVDAVLDIGAADARLHVFAGAVPLSRRFSIGGAAFTETVAQAFGLDPASAERRKHGYGIAGCGETLLDAFVADVAGALVECRVDGIADVRTIALSGNGARLTELPGLLERSTAVRVRLAEFDPAVSTRLPPDVLRAAAPDWVLAYGLALWGLA